VGEEARRIHFAFPQPPRTGRTVARLVGVHKAYGDNVVYAGMEFAVERAQRVPVSLTKGRLQRPLVRTDLLEMLEPLRRRT